MADPIHPADVTVPADAVPPADVTVPGDVAPPSPPGALPEDAILLHLGFHKTGTTALQSAFAASRPALLEHGVLYPGRRRSHHPAAMAMTDRTWGVGRAGGWEPDPRDWTRLARACVRHPGRVLVSSESFALTPDDAAARMVADLGPQRVHVVFTLRPVSALLSSSWQQYLKSGWTITYHDWLDQMVSELEPGQRRSGFWRRNDYPTIVGRWADLVGPERVHLVCLDAGDRGFLLRTFEALLGLPAGVVTPDRADSNRSMTAAEAELLRCLNEASTDWDWPTYQRTIRAGAAAAIVESRRPSADEDPITTPRWVVDRTAEHGRVMAGALAKLGVVVHGDLSILGQPVAAAIADEQPDVTLVPLQAAVAGVLGAIRGAQRLAGESVQPPGEGGAEAPAAAGSPGAAARPAPSAPLSAPAAAGRASSGRLGRASRRLRRAAGRAVRRAGAGR
jgi:hypothetical protein